MLRWGAGGTANGRSKEGRYELRITVRFVDWPFATRRVGGSKGTRLDGMPMRGRGAISISGSGTAPISPNARRTCGRFFVQDSDGANTTRFAGIAFNSVALDWWPTRNG